MVSRVEMKKQLNELRDQQAAVVADLEHKLAEARVRLNAYETAIATVEGSPIPTGQKGRRSNVKKMVMDLINEAAQAGVTAVSVVERGGALGKQLDRGSVSSLLSRLKREGTLTFDGERYRPADPKTDPAAAMPLRVVKAS
jgi:hypothetical protein